MLNELMVMDRDAPDFCEKLVAAEQHYLGKYPYLPMVWDRYEFLVKPWVKNFETNVDNNWKTLLDMYIVDHPDRNV